MAQICAMLDNYGWSPMVIVVFVQRVLVPMQGGTPNETMIAEAPKGDKESAMPHGGHGGMDGMM